MTVLDKLNFYQLYNTFRSFRPKILKNLTNSLFSFSTTGSIDDRPSSLYRIKKDDYDSSSNELSEVLIILLGIM